MTLMVAIPGDRMRAALRAASAAVPLTMVRDWAAQADADSGFGLDVHRDRLRRALDADAVPVSPAALAASLAAEAGIAATPGVEFYFHAGLPVLLGAHVCDLCTFTAGADTVVLRGFKPSESSSVTIAATLRPDPERPFPTLLWVPLEAFVPAPASAHP
jgi:hypothetical protein